tara:strand:+ start:39 stop:278 length:240 start_codon:yes stop_codon:yes gene_type:complete
VRRLLGLLVRAPPPPRQAPIRPCRASTSQARLAVAKRRRASLAALGRRLGMADGAARRPAAEAALSGAAYVDAYVINNY